PSLGRENDIAVQRQVACGGVPAPAGLRPEGGSPQHSVGGNANVPEGVLEVVEPPDSLFIVPAQQFPAKLVVRDLGNEDKATRFEKPLQPRTGFFVGLGVSECPQYTSIRQYCPRHSGAYSGK